MEATKATSEECVCDSISFNILKGLLSMMEMRSNCVNDRLTCTSLYGDCSYGSCQSNWIDQPLRHWHALKCLYSSAAVILDRFWGLIILSACLCRFETCIYFLQLSFCAEVLEMGLVEKTADQRYIRAALQQAKAVSGKGYWEVIVSAHHQQGIAAKYDCLSLET